MTTDAQRQAEAVSDQIEAIRLSSNTEGMQVGENLQSSNEDISGEITDIRYRNNISIWNRESGVHSYALPYMAADLAKQRIKTGPYAGQSAFVFRKSDIPAEVMNRPQSPKMPCYLHAEHPTSSRWLSMGFASCTTKNIPSQAALESHMWHSHKRAWETIQKDEADKQLNDERALARENLAALQALVQQAATTVTPAPSPVETTEQEDYHLVCDICNEDFSGKSRAGASASLRAHEKREHSTTE